MENLIPEQRPDKNGKMVTRHVKPDSSTGSLATSFPPPNASPVKPHVIVLPGEKVTPMTKDDFGTIADVLEMCGSYNSDDLAHVSPYIRDGDIEALRIFKEHAGSCGFSTVVDVIENTHSLFSAGRPANYGEQIAAHIRIADSGSFDYYDISGNGENEEILRIIHENISQADSIRIFLEERGTDPDALRDYLANDVAAVREGTL